MSVAHSQPRHASLRRPPRLLGLCLGALGLVCCCTTGCTSPPSLDPTSSYAVPTITSRVAASTPARHTTPGQFQLCDLLSWHDLPQYPGVSGPPQTPPQAGWPQYCQWPALEGNAGYTPPPQPTCTVDPNDLAGSITCAGADAGQVSAVFGNSAFYTVSIGWRPGPVTDTPTGTWTIRGHVVRVVDHGSGQCYAYLSWAGGTLQVQVNAPTDEFGTPAAQVRQVVTVLIGREPNP
jgi:hypothetical protein